MYRSLRLFLPAFFALFVCALSPVFAAEEATQIDLLLLFDSTAARAVKKAHQSTETVAYAAMAQLNEVLANSQTPEGTPLLQKVRFGLAGYETLNYTGKSKAQDDDGISADLEYLTTSEKIENLRDKHHADLVILLVGYSIEHGGTLGAARALSMINAVTSSQDKVEINNNNFAAIFSVYCVLQTNTTFPHEVSHLLMCGHSDTQLYQTGPQLQPDSRGFMLRADDGWPLAASLMTYNSGFSEHEGSLSYVEQGNKKKGKNNLGYCMHFPANGEPQHGKFDLNRIRALSGPYTIKTKIAEKNVTIPCGDEQHNNVRNVLQFAPYVASYRLSGREVLGNDAFHTASDMGLVYTNPHEPVVRSVQMLRRINLVEKMYSDLEVVVTALVNKDWNIINQFVNLVQSRLTEIKNIKSPEDYDDAERTIFTKNDLARAIRGKWYWIWGNNHTATREVGEPVVHPQAVGKTVWYRFEPEEDGIAYYNIRKSYTSGKVVAAAFEGENVDALTPAEEHSFRDESELSGDDAGYYYGSGSCYVRKGRPLYLAVDSIGEEGAFFNILFRVEAKELPPLPQPAEPEPETTTEPGPTTEPTSSPGPEQPDKPNPPDGPVQQPTVPEPEQPVAGDPLPDVPPEQPSATVAQDSGTTLALIILGVMTAFFAGGMGAALYKLHRLTQAASPTEAGRGTVQLSGTLSNGRTFNKKLKLQQLQAVHNFYIGSGKDSQLVIRDTGIEPRHAVFKVRNGQLLLGDAGSYAGTVVNGRRLHQDECIRVLGHCVCKLGGATLNISAALPDGMPTPASAHAVPDKSIRFSVTTSEGMRQNFIIPVNDIASVRNYTIGRASDNNLVLADPTVSGHHAVIKLRQGKLLIGDAGSSSGTVVDGTALNKDDCVVVRRNTAGRLGGLHFTITII